MKELLIVAIILCSLNVVSSAQDTLQNAFAIQVKQNYECWNKCDDGYPHLDKMRVTISNSNAGVKKGEISKEEGNGRYKGTFTKLVKKGFSVIKVEDILAQ